MILGALVLADSSVCGIDEFDKMSEATWSVRGGGAADDQHRQGGYYLLAERPHLPAGPHQSVRTSPTPRPTSSCADVLGLPAPHLGLCGHQEGQEWQGSDHSLPPPVGEPYSAGGC